MTGPALPELQSAVVDGRRISWREAGRGEALVLVHGIGGHSGAWRHQLAEFADAFRTLAWDAPGYGSSDPAPEATVDHYARALAALLRRLDIHAPHLVGHSLGAIIIAAACRHHGVAARSLTFLQSVTGSGMLPEDERARVRQARIEEMRRLGPQQFAIERGRAILSKRAPTAAVEEAVGVMSAVPEAGYLAAWDMMCGADLFTLLEPTVRPNLVVCGSDDPVCPPELAGRIAARLGGAACHCLDGVGHYASIEAPERLNSLLRTFFAGVA
ncbi:MAG: alpha/beta fold hydrolase [Hyphomicrobiales bacterium]|nr:alpha/beta fold hydrolase [Hyphomicrobiales bacterium]